MRSRPRSRAQARHCRSKRRRAGSGSSRRRRPTRATSTSDRLSPSRDSASSTRASGCCCSSSCSRSAALLARATWLSTVRAASLSKLAQAQTKSQVVLAAGRGTIFDAMGTPLALGEQATTVFADPRQIAKPQADARIAARILGLKRRTALSDRSPTASHGFVYVDRKAPPDKATLLAKRGLTGFYFYARGEARLPAGPVAAPVLGYAGVDNSGLAGLELELNAPLTGTPGEETVVRDPLGHVDRRAEREARARRARTSSSRSTTRSRRTPSRCCARPLRSGARRTRPRSCSTRRPARVLAMAKEPGYNANSVPAGARRRACRRTTRSPTSTSPARCSRS